METAIKIADHTIWFKHVNEPKLRERLNNLHDEEEINLEVGGVIGRWKRMRTGKDGRRTDAIKPDGAMKKVWNDWYRTRKGEELVVREISLADDYLAAGSTLFSEWNSSEDDEAFRDL